MDSDVLQQHRRERLKHARWQPQKGVEKGSNSSDPYTILGIPKHADFAEIRAAYLALAQLHHPDKQGVSWTEQISLMRKAVTSRVS